MTKKILIIEDDHNMRKLAKYNLEKEGYFVIATDSGMEGLQLARNEYPDLLITDCLLPKIDGFKVCRMLRFDQRFKHLPIIMLTGQVTEKSEETGKEVGVNIYLRKPYQPEVLLEKVRELLGKGD